MMNLNILKIIFFSSHSLLFRSQNFSIESIVSFWRNSLIAEFVFVLWPLRKWILTLCTASPKIPKFESKIATYIAIIASKSNALLLKQTGVGRRGPEPSGKMCTDLNILELVDVQSILFIDVLVFDAILICIQFTLWIFQTNGKSHTSYLPKI